MQLPGDFVGYGNQVCRLLDISPFKRMGLTQFCAVLYHARCTSALPGAYSQGQFVQRTVSIHFPHASIL